MYNDELIHKLVHIEGTIYQYQTTGNFKPVEAMCLDIAYSGIALKRFCFLLLIHTEKPLHPLAASQTKKRFRFTPNPPLCHKCAANRGPGRIGRKRKNPVTVEVTGFFMVIRDITNLREHKQKPLIILHFYGIGARGSNCFS